jgi:protein-S-isoprenylcysteine O-methyltransferase Ste14
VAAVSHDRFRCGLIAAGFCVSALFFIRLPAIMGRGVRPLGFDGFARIATSFSLPTAALIILLIFRSLAKRDPFRMNYRRFRRTYETSLDLATVLVLGTHLLLLGQFMLIRQAHLGPWISYVPTCLVGFVLIVAGNILPRLRPNGALGVRTRWTLRDETVWMKTHRAGGYVLLVFGLTLIAWTFIDFQGVWWVLGPGLVVTIVGLPVLSWLVGRHQRRVSPSPAQEATGRKESQT